MVCLWSVYLRLFNASRIQEANYLGELWQRAHLRGAQACNRVEGVLRTFPVVVSTLTTASRV